MDRREFAELLNRSSLGPIPDSRPVATVKEARLTGMREEQRDWEINMGGKPSKGTPKDKRIKGNKK